MNQINSFLDSGRQSLDCGLSRASGDELVRLAQQGNEVAFSQLFVRYSPFVLGLISSKLSNLQDSEEILQEVFLAVFRDLRRLRDATKFEAWLVKIAKRRIADFYRDQSREPKLRYESEHGLKSNIVPYTNQSTPAELSDEETVRTLVMSAIVDLRPKLRAVVYLRLVEGVTSAEIARRLDQRESTVRMRLRRGLRQLRLRLGPTFGGVEHEM